MRACSVSVVTPCVSVMLVGAVEVDSGLVSAIQLSIILIAYNSLLCKVGMRLRSERTKLRKERGSDIFSGCLFPLARVVLMRPKRKPRVEDECKSTLYC